MRRTPPIDIRSFGALESAAPSVNAAAIETALHAAAANGGGTVVVPPGIWNTGTIRLRSHVELHLPIPTLSDLVGRRGVCYAAAHGTTMKNAAAPPPAAHSPPHQAKVAGAT